MSSSTPDARFAGSPDPKLEAQLREIASTFVYPATPDFAGQERQRLRSLGQPGFPRRRITAPYGWALAILVLLAALLLVSPVRARVLDWIRIGAVRIFLIQPTATPIPPLPSGTPSPEFTLTSAPTPTPLTSILDIAGETDLTEARSKAGFSIQLPATPPDLGQPDHVYLQELSGPVVVLVWMDKDHPGKVRMSLSETFQDQIMFQKYEPQSVQDTQVNGQPAVWINGSYLLVTGNGDTTMTRLIESGHTLIWTVGKRTFRLETDVDLNTAIQIAQSIR